MDEKSKSFTPTELAAIVKSTLMSKPNKSVLFKSFANGMNNDFLPFLQFCNKQLDAVKQKRINKLELELAALKKK